MIASDAQASGTSVSAAFLVVDCEDGWRWGAFWSFDSADLAALGYPNFPMIDENRNPIAAAEAAAVATTYVVLSTLFASRIKHRDAVHWIDNTVSLHSFVKGGSKCGAIDRACAIPNLLAFGLRFRVWYEFVPSDANWSDGASRNLGEDDFALENGFTLAQTALPRELWLCDIRDAWCRLTSDSS